MLETSDLEEADPQILKSVESCTILESSPMYLTNTPAGSEDLASALEQGVLENDIVTLNSSRGSQPRNRPGCLYSPHIRRMRRAEKERKKRREGAKPR